METFGGQNIYNGHSEAFKNIELCDRMGRKEYDHQFFSKYFAKLIFLQFSQELIWLYLKSSFKIGKFCGLFA